MDYGKVVSNIRNELKSYITEHDIKSLVVGVSGGIDSAVVCALARPVCDELSIPLIGRSIPIVSNKLDEIARAQLVGATFCTLFDAKDLSKLFWQTSFEVFNNDDIITRAVIKGEGERKIKIREGNLKARLRMIYLYDLAQKNGGMVLGTDNYTELLLGFWTLHGDVGDYGMIQNLWKSEVYELADWLVANECVRIEQKEALELCIDAIPTDGLGITESDYEQLGAKNYTEVDNILKTYITEKKRSAGYLELDILDHPVVKRYERTHFKRDNPVSIPRSVIDGA